MTETKLSTRAAEILHAHAHKFARKADDDTKLRFMVGVCFTSMTKETQAELAKEGVTFTEATECLEADAFKRFRSKRDCYERFKSKREMQCS